VHVDPIKPTLKTPGTKRLTLKYNRLLSILLQFCFNFAFKFNLRRYMKVERESATSERAAIAEGIAAAEAAVTELEAEAEKLGEEAGSHQPRSPNRPPYFKPCSRSTTLAKLPTTFQTLFTIYRRVTRQGSL
jgi:hypothetical protein